MRERTGRREERKRGAKRRNERKERRERKKEEKEMEGKRKKNENSKVIFSYLLRYFSMKLNFYN
jgi:hypothetical protein